MLLRILLGFIRISVTGVSPSLLALSRAFSYPSEYHSEVLQPREDKSSRFGLFPFRSPLLWESHSLSIPPLTEMFHFSGFTLPCLFYSARSDTVLPVPGFPIRTFPDQSALTAPRDFSQSCHVLHRLSSPRHPPIALDNLILSISNDNRRLCNSFQSFFRRLLLPTRKKLNCQRTKILDRTCRKWWAILDLNQ